MGYIIFRFRFPQNFNQLIASFYLVKVCAQKNFSLLNEMNVCSKTEARLTPEKGITLIDGFMMQPNL